MKMTNYVRSFYISKVPFLPFLHPIPKPRRGMKASVATAGGLYLPKGGL